MSLAIKTNPAALIAQMNLSSSNSRMKVSVQRLSSGFRVNSAADDAAGLGRADQLRSQSRMIQASIRNINDGVSALEVADKASEQISNIVTRLGELAATAAQGALDATSRSYCNDEYNKLILEIDRIANTTEFGGYKLLNGDTTALTMHIGFRNSSDDQLSVSMNTLLSAGSTPTIAHEMLSEQTVPNPGDDIASILNGRFSFTVGGGPPQTVGWIWNMQLDELVSNINNFTTGATASAVDVGGGNYALKLTSDTPGTGNDIVITRNDTTLQNFTQTPAQDGTPPGLGLSSNALTSIAGALGALDAVSAALKRVNDARAVYGASTNRLSASLSNLLATHTNYQAAESRIRDADFAFESAQYTRNQIIVQAGTSVLSQANSLPQNVLTLLR